MEKEYMQPTANPQPPAAPPPADNSFASPPPAPKSRRRLTITVILALVTAALLAAAWFYHTPKTGTPTKLSTGQEALADQDDSNYQHEATVELGDAAFTPSTLSVKLHTRVYFQNKGTKDHKLQANEQYTPDSTFAQGDTVTPNSGYAFNFHHAGTFLYHDALNPSINGSIIVTSN